MAIRYDTAPDLRAALAGYAERFHASIGDGHHVASPLGAWLLLALSARAATGAACDELAGVLGMDPVAAGEAAAALLDNPHPLVPSATAVWHQPGGAVGGLDGWLAGLPAATETGPLPVQAGLDEWAREHTLGLIDSFPLAASPDVLLVLASALATKVSWTTAFEVAPARALGPASAWANGLSGVLRSPAAPGHTAYVAATKRAGEVIVHTAAAEPVPSSWSSHAGLSVVSVAAAPDVKPVDVLAAAYEIASAAHDGRPPGRRSLYELPLGDGPLWTIREQPELTKAIDGRAERCQAVVPCWSASGDYDLSSPALGFPVASRILATLLSGQEMDFKARQSAVARYSRYGFEAAAVTAFAIIESVPKPGVVRIAELRFGHPYAVIAVATQRHLDATGESVPGPWDGIPVFSAWVSEPEDVADADLD